MVTKRKLCFLVSFFPTLNDLSDHQHIPYIHSHSSLQISRYCFSQSLLVNCLSTTFSLIPCLSYYFSDATIYNLKTFFTRKKNERVCVNRIKF